MLIKRLNKIINILDKRNHAVGIGSDIEQIKITLTYYPNNEDGEIKLTTTYHDHSDQHTERSVDRFWQDNINKFDLQKYIRECLEQLEGK